MVSRFATMVLFLLLAISAGSWAQGNHFGLTAGWHIAGVTPPPKPDVINLFSAYGFNNFHAGGWGEVRLHGQMHLRAEAHFATANVSGEVVILEENGVLSYQRTNIREQSYRFPILFNYYASDKAGAFMGATLVLLTRSEMMRSDLPSARPFRENRSDFDVAITTGMIVRVHPRVSATGWIARHINHYYNERPDAFFSPRLVTLGLSLCWRLAQPAKSEE